MGSLRELGRCIQHFIDKRGAVSVGVLGEGAAEGGGADGFGFLRSQLGEDFSDLVAAGGPR
jgi:hypothetical protein